MMRAFFVVVMQIGAMQIFAMHIGWILFGAAVADGASKTAATYNKDVLPVLQRKCQGCHRPGEAAPMSFLTYESTRPWAKAMRTAVITRKMPPWPADRTYGHFLNNPSLTQDEIDTLVAWADGGAQEGDPGDKPAPVRWPDGWDIKPDVVVSVPESPQIPAKGVVELMDVRIPSGFQKDTWITSIEIRPGNRSVVHHVILSVVPHDRKKTYGKWDFTPQERDQEGVALERIDGDDRLREIAGIEAVYVPGVGAADYRLHGAAKLIPAGSDLKIQMHYTPNGTATTDRTQVGFTVAKEVPKRRFITLNPTALRDAASFHIPAGDANWETRTEIRFNQNAEIVWFLPHMHLRGKDMTYRLVYPSGARESREPETLLSVAWDFNWQLAYDAERPIQVPKGSRLDVVAHFDNSANNRFNPNPKRDVWWGDQTWEEMMVPWLGVIVDRNTNPSKVVSYPREFAAGRRASLR